MVWVTWRSLGARPTPWRPPCDNLHLRSRFLQVGNLLSRLLLGSGFLGLLLLAPLLRHFVKWWMMRGGLWGKPVMVMGASDIGARLVRALQREWSLGLKPVAVFDNRLAPAGGALEGVPYRGTLTDAMSLARKQAADTV